MPPEGETVEGLFVPGTTAVYVNWIAMLQRKDIFGDDADMFSPERYLECSDEKKVEMERTVEMAFGAGRYQCSGKSIALAEIYKVVFEVSSCDLVRHIKTSRADSENLSQLFRHFDFQIVNPNKVWEEQSWANWTHHKMMVKITEDKYVQT